MPGSVANASVASGDVLPQALCTGFTEVREPPALLANLYHDGSRQASLLAQTSRKRFQLTRKVPASVWSTLQAFYAAHGGTVAFYFYNPIEASGEVGSNYDGTGASTTGRYTVVFFGQGWSQSVGMARVTVPLELLEVA